MMSSEIHISGEIDNFLFGYLRDPYNAELEKSINCFQFGPHSPDDFLKIFFSLFLENDPFSEDTNKQKFDKSIDIIKLERYCPNFFAIYQTILSQEETKRTFIDTSGQENENTLMALLDDAMSDLEKEIGYSDSNIKTNLDKKFEEPVIKTEKIRSTKYSIQSFLEEILDSPSHPSQNTDPEFDNQLRIFNCYNKIEFFKNNQKISETSLEEFFSSEYKNIDFDYNGEKRILNFDNATTPDYPELFQKIFKKLHRNMSPLFDFGGRVEQYQSGFLNFKISEPLHFINFLFGNLDNAKNPINLPWEYKTIKFNRSREVRVQYRNVAKYIFQFPDQIEMNKLAFLSYGCEDGRNINYPYPNESYNFICFNYLSYDGAILKPYETLYRDKGIQIDLSSNTKSEWKNGDRLPDFWTLTFD